MPPDVGRPSALVPRLGLAFFGRGPPEFSLCRWPLELELAGRRREHGRPDRGRRRGLDRHDGPMMSVHPRRASGDDCNRIARGNVRAPVDGTEEG